MARGFQIQIFGLARISKAIERGNKRKRRKALDRMRDRAQKVKQTMKSKIPIGPSGNLRKSVTSTVGWKGRELGMEVGPSSRRRGYHAFLVDQGTKSRVQKSTGRSTGRGPARKYADATMKAINIKGFELMLSRSMFDIGRGR